MLNDNDRKGNIRSSKTDGIDIFSDLHSCVYGYFKHEITEVEAERAY